MLDAMEEPLVGSRGCRVEVGAEPTGILWLGNAALLTLGDGSVRHVTDAGEVANFMVHNGAILAGCRHPDGRSVVTGGDDGRVCRVTPTGEIREMGQFERHWVEHIVASAASGLIIAGVGHEAVVWTREAVEPSHRYAIGSTIGGLALDGKGKRLGISHYNGATMLYPSSAGSGRVALKWVGSHLACTMSADGRYLVTALQETGLHGWLLPNLSDMRMSGYGAKTRSFSWDRRGKWLATSGDARAILWPFDGKTGPMGKAPLLVAERTGAMVTRVAFHPRSELLAVGYDDGVVVLTQIGDDRPLLVDDEGAAISALSWNETGARLGWGDAAGRVGILDMDARA